MTHEHVIGNADARDRRKIIDRVVRQLRIEARVDAMRARGAHDQRVTIGRTFGHNLGADYAVRTGAIVDDHLLSPRFSELVADRARYEIGGTAGCERYNDAYRTRGIARGFARLRVSVTPHAARKR